VSNLFSSVFSCSLLLVNSLDLSWLHTDRIWNSPRNGTLLCFYGCQTSSRPALRPTKPPIQWVLGDLSPRVKLQGLEADHSPPTSAEVNKMWIYTSTPPYAFMA
jgi:hypothetical protein